MISASIGGAFLFIAIQWGFQWLPQGKDLRRVGLVGAYTVDTLPPSILEKVSIGLTVIDQDGTADPGIAERWTAEDNGKSYRFVLRDDVIWHDGSRLKPTDIQLSFADTQIVRTEREIVYQLAEEFAAFPVLVSRPLLKNSTTLLYGFLQRRTILGLGPYEITRFRLNQDVLEELVIESSDERIQYRFYPTEERAVLGYLHGEVDELEDLLSKDAFESKRGVEVSDKLLTDQVVGIFFNTSDPLFTKGFRQALNYSIEKPIGEARALSSYHADNWAYNPAVKTYTQDLNKAVDLFIKEAPQQPIRFQLLTTPAYKNLAEMYQQQWKILGEKAVERCRQEKSEGLNCDALNIEIDLQVSSAPNTQDFQVLLIAQKIPEDPDQYLAWHSTQPTNFTRYANPNADKLLEDGRKTIKIEDRRAIYQEFQQVLVDDSPAIFLFHPVSYRAKRK